MPVVTMSSRLAVVAGQGLPCRHCIQERIMNVLIFLTNFGCSVVSSVESRPGQRIIPAGCRGYQKLLFSELLVQVSRFSVRIVHQSGQLSGQLLSKILHYHPYNSQPTNQQY